MSQTIVTNCVYCWFFKMWVLPVSLYQSFPSKSFWTASSWRWILLSIKTFHACFSSAPVSNCRYPWFFEVKYRITSKFRLTYYWLPITWTNIWKINERKKWMNLKILIEWMTVKPPNNGILRGQVFCPLLIVFHYSEFQLPTKAANGRNKLPVNEEFLLLGVSIIGSTM